MAKIRRLCEYADVTRVFDPTGRFTQEEIEAEIDNQTEDIYEECGDPIAASKSYINKYTDAAKSEDFYMEYYLGEKRIALVERVFVGTVTKRELYEPTDYEVQGNLGMIKLTSSTVGGFRLDESEEIIMYYVPHMFAKYCALRTAQALLEKLDITNNGKSSRELDVINRKLQVQERLMSERIGVVRSSSNEYYDDVYGVNMKRVNQDHDANLYIWRKHTIDE